MKNKYSKKLLILSPPIPPNQLGGDGKFALDIAKELSRLGLKVILVSPFYNGQYHQRNYNKNLTSYQIPIISKKIKNGWDFPIWEPRVVAKRNKIFLKFLLESKFFDKNKIWIHEIGGSLFNSLLTIIKKREGIGYSCHVQFVLSNYDKFIPNMRSYKKISLRSQEQLVSLSKISFFLSKIDLEAFSHINTPKKIVPNGVKFKKVVYKKKIDKKLNIFIGGRLYSPMKGAVIILPILSRVMNNCDNVELHICAPDKTYFGLFDKSILNRVHFYAWKSVSETQKILRKCQLSIVPSLYEPFGLMALESLANNTPVLASKNGGLEKIVVPGKNGEFIDLSKPLHIEQLIGDFARNPRSIKRYLGNNKSIKQYRIRNIANLYLKYLGEFLR